MPTAHASPVPALATSDEHLQQDIDRALEQERRQTIAAASRVRAAGSILFLLIIGVAWLLTGRPDWLVYVRPLALYAALSCALFLFRHHRLARFAAHAAVLLDVGVVGFLQLSSLPLSPFPAGVAGFSLGIFGLLVALNALTMRASVIYLAALVSLAAQCQLMAAADVSVAPMIAAAVVLLLEARVLEVLIRRLRTFVRDLTGAEVERQVQQRKVTEIEAQRQTIETLLVAARDQNEELRELQEYKGRLTQLLVHDLRAPLSVLTMSVDLMDQGLRKEKISQQQLTEDLHAVRDAGKRLRSMIDDILAISKLEDRQLEVRRTKFGAAALLQTIARELGQLRPSCPQPFEVLASAELELDGDEGLLKRVLENLTTNAVRYALNDHPIGLTSRRVDNCVIIGVHNHGIPIAQEVRGRLFEKYQQANGSHGGWGLGLYFCRLAVEAHGGTIAVEDVEGWTTSFLLRLPLRS